jgi:hypothetical protein
VTRSRLFAGAAALCAMTSAAFGADVPSCYMNIPKDAYTIAFGVYEGERVSPVQLTSRTAMDTKIVEIKLAKRDEPYFVVLSSYDPTFWRLDIEDGAKISGIVALGYYAQAVGNVPPFVPVGISTMQDGRGDDCPTPMYVYDKGPEFAKFETLISDEYGKAIDEYYGKYSTSCLPAKLCISRPAQAAGWWDSLFGTKAAAPVKTGPAGEIRSATRIKSGG